MNNDFLSQLKYKQNLIKNELALLMNKSHKTLIYETMSYTLLAKSKAIRPLLLIGSCEDNGGNASECMPFACAIEMIHSYSLIHDDLPCMDNDDYRRGKPACHKTYGEAIAILTGDGLLNLAYEIMINACINDNSPKYLKAMKQISDASGIDGIIGGQIMDILSENKNIDEETLLYIHKNKTCSLISASITAGAFIGGADKEKLELYKEAGDLLGLSFQIKDDILDITGTKEQLGKTANSDISNNKSTYVSLFGMDKANNDHIDYSNRAISLFEQLNSNFLKDLAIYLVSRKN